jgi:hypothetical protein
MDGRWLFTGHSFRLLPLIRSLDKLQYPASFEFASHFFCFKRLSIQNPSSIAVLIGLLFCFDLTFGFCRKVGEEKERDKTYTMELLFADVGDFRFDLYDGNLMGMGMQWNGMD